MTVAEDDEAGLAAKFAVMRELLDERQWRVYLGTEARALGRGGIAAVARASGASRVTVAAGAAQAADPDVLAALARGRPRRPGAGRPKAEDAQPGLGQALGSLVEEATRGDPMPEITWCSRSLRDLERQLAARGFRCGKDAIARMLRGQGYSLQAMAKVLEGRQHPGRDGQFRHINAMIAAFGAAGYPVISADTKKKEQLGPFHRDGRAWRPKGGPVKVRDHDFPDEELGKITPYGVYDIAADTGFVSAGTSCDTGAFAVNALRLWWRAEGSLRYPGASSWPAAASPSRPPPRPPAPTCVPSMTCVNTPQQPDSPSPSRKPGRKHPGTPGASGSSRQHARNSQLNNRQLHTGGKYTQ